LSPGFLDQFTMQRQSLSMFLVRETKPRPGLRWS
jgi:hypothetical protein